MTATANTTVVTTLPTATKYEDVLTASELATVLGVTPRQLRRAARKAGNGVGRGHIYALPLAGIEDAVTFGNVS